MAGRATPGTVAWCMRVMTTPEWGRLRSNATARDAGLAAAVSAGLLLLILHGGPGESHVVHGRLHPAGVLVAALSVLPLVAWRRWPLGVLVLTGAANVMLVVVAGPIGVPLGPAVALYLVAVARENAHPRIGLVVGAAAAVLVAYLTAVATRETGFPGAELLTGGLALGVAWFAGERTRLRREHIAELKRDAERERRLAAAEERARIARDLHDPAGHAVNVIAVRAGAARLRHRREPDRSLAALKAIEDLARHTVDEIDRIVGALRERENADDAGVESPPGVASLDTLVAHHMAAGLDVTLRTDGKPRPLARAADQAAYRIMQEALTNASRHGTGPVVIAVDFEELGIDITVTNGTVGTAPARNGGGHGIVGMRERAASVDGDLDIEQSDGTYRLHARIPYAVGRS